jgi:hypothetical protein
VEVLGKSGASVDEIRKVFNELLENIVKTIQSGGGGAHKTLFDFSTMKSSQKFFVDKLFKGLPINEANIMFLYSLGIPCPFVLNVWTTNVVYGGHAFPAVLPGQKTGHAGMSQIGMEQVSELHSQFQVDMYVRFATFISQENGLARRELLLINDVLKKDNLTYLSLDNTIKGADIRQRYQNLGMRNTVNFESHEGACDGHVFCTFELAGKQFGEVSSFLGQALTSENFVPKKMVIENDQFTHSAAPLVMNHMDNHPDWASRVKNHFLLLLLLLFFVCVCVCVC